MMLVVALAFDLLQLAAKIFLLLGLVVVGGVVGGYLGSFVGLTGTGSAVGSFIGGLLSFTGIGTSVAFFVGFALSWTLSLMVAIIGYSTIGLWLLMKGVSPLSGNKATRKMTTLLVAAVIDIAPLLNALPGITLWTFFTIQASRAEDKERHVQETVEYNRSMRRMRRRRVAANDNDETIEYERFAA